MSNLAGKSVGATVVEFYGPITGRNYNVSGSATPVTPEITVAVRGEGSIQLQQTQTGVIKGNPGPNVFTSDRVADETTWVDLGTPISAASGEVTVNPTVGFPFSSVRAVIVAEGRGTAVIQCDWN